MSAVIEISGLTKSYGSVRAVESLDLTVRKGEVFGFLGPNGAGKTTTIRVIMGFLKPTCGAALVFGHDCWSERTRVKARTGFLPDSPSLYGNLTGHEFLDHLLRLYGRRESRNRDVLCERLEFDRDDLSRKVGDYSSGMRQKMAIIQTFQHEPELVIMDEPSASLDPLMQKAFLGILDGFRREGGTAFVSSHMLSEVEEVCERVAIVRGGRLVAVEEVEEVRDRLPRRIEISLSREVADESLPLRDAEVVFRDGLRMRLLVKGDINRVVRRLAAIDLDDLVIEKPSLEDVFMDFYEDRAEGG